MRYELLFTFISERSSHPGPLKQVRHPLSIRNCSQELLADRTTPGQIEDLLKDLRKAFIEHALEGELTDLLGYPKHHPDGRRSGNSRNGFSRKTVKTDDSEIEVNIPRDRHAAFDPKLIAKLDSYENHSGASDKAFMSRATPPLVKMKGLGPHFHRNRAQVERLIKDLRRYAAQSRNFLGTFTEINERLWHTKPPPDYGADGRRARTKNYQYFYTKVSDETCAFWALPVGPQRHYAVSFFVVGAPGWLRAWKGKPLSDEQIAKIAAIPSPELLADLGLNEMPQRTLNAK